MRENSHGAHTTLQGLVPSIIKPQKAQIPKKNCLFPLWQHWWQNPGHSMKPELPEFSSLFLLRQGLAKLPRFAFLKIDLFRMQLCVGMDMHVPWPVCWSQRTTCRSKFSPSTTWVPEIKLRSSGLVVYPCPLSDFMGPALELLMFLPQPPEEERSKATATTPGLNNIFK